MFLFLQIGKSSQNLNKKIPPQQNPLQQDPPQQDPPPQSPLQNPPQNLQEKSMSDTTKDEKDVQKEVISSPKPRTIIKAWKPLVVEALGVLGKGKANDIRSYIKENHEDFVKTKSEKMNPTITS